MATPPQSAVGLSIQTNIGDVTQTEAETTAVGNAGVRDSWLGKPITEDNDGESIRSFGTEDGNNGGKRLSRRRFSSWSDVAAIESGPLGGIAEDDAEDEDEDEDEGEGDDEKGSERRVTGTARHSAASASASASTLAGGTPLTPMTPHLKDQLMAEYERLAGAHAGIMPALSDAGGGSVVGVSASVSRKNSYVPSGFRQSLQQARPGDGSPSHTHSLARGFDDDARPLPSLPRDAHLAAALATHHAHVHVHALAHAGRSDTRSVLGGYSSSVASKVRLWLRSASSVLHMQVRRDNKLLPISHPSPPSNQNHPYSPSTHDSWDSANPRTSSDSRARAKFHVQKSSTASIL
ncbi:hypothetical protein HK100_003844 [Physocladia obscura]|uniref:Uncharacterized protein n=1 Tax=Physocladia obscura TaxID=109957 RepID=A0AAD5SUH1_9FUNG|nr:hypothetical protein HK100_003844 [Physocladia obscura]